MKESLNLIDTWKCTNHNGIDIRPSSFKGFYLSVNSILTQWDEMKSEGASYLLSTRLQQDHLENLFTVLRSRAGDNRNATATQVGQNLQYACTANLISNSYLKNCTPYDTIALH